MTGLPSSMALGGDILCTCGNTPSLDGLFPSTADGHVYEGSELTDGTPILFYRCDRCGTVHDYAAMETERDTMPWRAGVLETLLTDPWEQLETRDTYAGVLWDEPTITPVDLARQVAGIIAHTRYCEADESDDGNADRYRVEGDVWRIPDTVTAHELVTFAGDLVGMFHATVNA